MDHAASPPAALPVGTRLMHVGPSKTGTTSVQGACWVARHELRRQGVRYAGPVRHSANAARAATRSPRDRDDTDIVPAWFWQGIVREIRRAPEARTFYSSEYLAHAREPEIRRIRDDLGADRIHVVVTLRPIARMLTSLWQQRIADGGTRSLDDWLTACLGVEGSLRENPLWWVHKHHELVTRWAGVVGVERVTVLVVDPTDQERLLRDLEALLAIRAGVLKLQPDFVNRSLTLPEAEALRAFNAQLRAAGVRHGTMRRIVGESISSYMETRTPPKDEEKIRLPARFAPRVEPLAHAIVDGIRGSGVRVVGDLDTLLAPATTVPESERGDAPIPAELAATLAMGVAYAGGILHGTARGTDHLHLRRELELPYLSLRDLVSVPVARARRLGPLWLRYRLGLGAP